MNKEIQTVKDRLRAMIESKRTTHAKIAEACGVSQPTVTTFVNDDKKCGSADAFMGYLEFVGGKIVYPWDNNPDGEIKTSKDVLEENAALKKEIEVLKIRLDTLTGLIENIFPKQENTKDLAS